MSWDDNDSNGEYLWSQLMESDEEDDEEDIELTSNTVLGVILAAGESRRSSDTFYVRDRMEWNLHVASLLNEGNDSFRRMYRMEFESFTNLCAMLHPFLSVDKRMSTLRTSKSSITTEIILHCLIRWLAGGSYLDIRVSAGISSSAFYRCIHSAMVAILSVPELQIRLPENAAEFSEVAKGFESISGTNGILNGCVGVLDGYLLQTTTVSRSEVGNVKAYFSGHYQCYGVNIQGMVDSRCRFLFLGAAAPGGSNDIVAYRKCGVHEYINNLSLGQYVIGDNAYVCSEHLLTPFAGLERADLKKDAYNFYISQLRIRVEMAFGMMSNRWLILKRPVSVSAKAYGKLILVIGVLHNYCLNEFERLSKGTSGSVAVAASQMFQGGDDNGSNIDGSDAFMASDVTVVNVPGNSIMRDFLVDQIAAAGLRRPGGV